MSQSYCIHEPHMYVDTEIFEKKYSTDEVLVNVRKISPNLKHYVFKFQKGSDKDWHYLPANKIRRCKVQRNGNGEVFAVPMRLCEQFKPIVKCSHAD